MRPALASRSAFADRASGATLLTPTRARRELVEAAAGGAERVADRHVDVLVRAVDHGIAADLDVGAGDRELDTDPEPGPVTVALVRSVDHDLAALDSIEGVAEPDRPAANERVDCGARIEIAQRDHERKSGGSSYERGRKIKHAMTAEHVACRFPPAACHLLRIRSMLATATDFTTHVAAHAGMAPALAEHATRTVLAAFAGYLGPARSELLAEELPPALAEVLRAPEAGSGPVEERVRALGISTSHARELVASVCRVLAEELSHEALHALGEALPAELGALVAPPAPERKPPTAGHGSSLSSGRPGSQHPLTEASGPGHTHTVAEPDPHGATKLSSAIGTTQERLHETLAEGHPRRTHR
jgi:uncharacterized protein (DUF2267 family)